MDRLRRPFLLASLVLIALAVLVSLGSTAIIGSDEELATPGQGIRALALLDLLLLWQLLLMASPWVIPERLSSRIQGVASLIVSVLALLGGIVLLLIAVALLVLMVALFLAVPFGTAVYLAGFGDFPYRAAAATLSVILLLKLAAFVCLFLAQQRFLRMPGIMLLFLTSIIATVVIQFLHGLVPRVLMSITDGIGALIALILGLIWALVMLIYSIPAIVKAVRLDRAVR
jgi:hypothetical protein